MSERSGAAINEIVVVSLGTCDIALSIPMENALVTEIRSKSAFKAGGTVWVDVGVIYDPQYAS